MKTTRNRFPVECCSQRAWSMTLAVLLLMTGLSGHAVAASVAPGKLEQMHQALADVHVATAATRETAASLHRRLTTSQLPSDAKRACESPASLRQSFSAALYDAAAPGDGFYLVADAVNVSVAFFGYAGDGTLRWLVGTLPRASLQRNVAAVFPLLTGGSGGRFVAPQDPAINSIPAWGQLALTLSCDGSSRLSGQGQLTGLDGSKSMQLTAIVDGGSSEASAAAPIATDRIGAVLYDEAASGDGFYLVGDEANLSIAFFGYAASGDLLWLVGTVPMGSVSGAPGQEIVFPLLQGGSAGRFDSPQNPALQMIPNWGQVVLTLDCGADGRMNGVARLNGLDGTKQMSLTSLLDAGACDRPATTKLTIAISDSSPAAYHPQPLVLDTDAALDQLSVQVDFSGRGEFRSDDVIRGPLALQAGQGVYVAPPVFLFQPQAAAPAYHLRVVAADGVSSNVLRLTQPRQSLDGVPRGLPSVLLDLVLKGIYSEVGDPRISGVAGQIQPGAAETALRALGEDTQILNEHAAALLKATFGFDVANPAQNRSADGKFLSGVRQAMQSLMDCVGEHLDEFFVTPPSSANRCDPVQRVRDGIIPAISDLHGNFSRVTSGLSSLLGNRAGGAITEYARRVAFSSEVTGYTSEFAQIAMRLGPFEADNGALLDYIGDRLTEYGRSRLFDALTAGFSEFDQQVLETLGGADALAAIGAFTGEQIAGLRGLEDRLLNTGALGDQLERSPESYGGPVPDGPGDSSIPPIGEGDTPASVCAAMPELGFAAISFGFATCEDYVRPFFDPAFVESTLLPLLDSLSRLTDQLAAQCLGDAAGSAACDALLDQLLALIERINEELMDYDVEGCRSGYSEFDLGSSLTCVWQSLIASSSSACPAGSRPPNYAVGNNAICTFYSRDYVRGGQCLTNYTLVFWEPLNANTCRWADLSIDLPAAYSVDKATNNRRTLER